MLCSSHRAFRNTQLHSCDVDVYKIVSIIHPWAVNDRQMQNQVKFNTVQDIKTVCLEKMCKLLTTSELLQLNN